MRLLTHFAAKFGKRHMELGMNWIPSAAAYGGTAFLALIYFTDWKVIAGKIPIYNTKFKDQ
ncbi:UNVERIFIED_CONTAM: hypothetical protein PYX00_000630 [Menopon gallinae]|uniref:Cytochrome b-c1 complex subunit 10 n=1 Tax=Menopon gallinae TaxID=328185 RepID=A0AAW2I9Z9_9NEOP